MEIAVELEEWAGSAVIRNRDRQYQRKPAASYLDAAASMTPRQAVFYRNLIRIAEVLKNNTIPVDFEIPGRGAVYLDRGCIKMAADSGFLAPLTDAQDGLVESIQLSWNV